MEIVQLPAKDLVLIQPLWEQLNSTHYNNSSNWKSFFAAFTFEKRIRKLLKLEKLTIFTAKDGARFVGYCIGSVQDGVGEIDSIFVMENYRHLGLGEKLLSSCIDWLREQRVNGIKVEVVEGNESVFPFYEKAGFKVKSSVLKLDTGDRGRIENEQQGDW